MKVLVTGAAGFVGPYVVEALHDLCGANLDVIATSKNGERHPILKQVRALDVLDAEAVRSFVASYRPSHVIHLAGMAAPQDAQAKPASAWQLHLFGTLNIANAIRDLVPQCWLIHVSSGLVYGDSLRSGLPLDETAVLAPVSDYAVTKAAADLAVGAQAQRGLRCLRVRPFNYTGPGQSEAFVVPAFAAQIARIEAGLIPAVIEVGNLDTELDFLDVRDVARAYVMTVLKVDEIASSTVFNVASGVPRRVGDILDWFLAHSRVKINIRRDAERSDLGRMVGDAQRIREIIGWKPEYSFEETLEAILFNYRKSLGLQE